LVEESKEKIGLGKRKEERSGLTRVAFVVGL
jgi:hypothetical protein